MHFVYRHCDTQQLYCFPPKTATKKAVAALQHKNERVCQPMSRVSEQHGFTLGPPQLMPHGCVRVGTMHKHNRTRNRYAYSPVKRRRIEESESESESDESDESDESFSEESEGFAPTFDVSQLRLLNTALAANLQPHVVRSVQSLNGKVCVFSEYAERGRCWACNRTRMLTHIYGGEEPVGRMCAAKINAAVKACVNLQAAQVAHDRASQSIYNFINTAQNITDSFS